MMATKQVENVEVDIPVLPVVPVAPVAPAVPEAMDTDAEETKPPQKRSKLLTLMGFPENVDDEKYEVELDEVEGDGEEEAEAEDKNVRPRRPRWRKVLQRLKSNPEEASICEDSKYPLDDALWIQTPPVPQDVLIRFLRVCPEAFTEQTYEIACNNPNTRPKVMKLLRGADLTGDIVEERPVLLRLMGYPMYKWDNNYCHAGVKPDWDAVRNRLVTHPGEAKIDEDGCFPLADAVWIKSDPVPVDIVKRLIEICPESLTDQAFLNAAHPKARPEVLRLMFSKDKKLNVSVNPSSSGDDSYVKVD